MAVTDQDTALIDEDGDSDTDGQQSFTVGESDNDTRLDKFLAAQDSALSRSRIKTLIQDGQVTIDARPCTSPSTKVNAGAEISITVPPPIDSTPQPENIPLDILFEDDDMLVLCKPAGLVVHPGAGNWTGTLVNALLYHCGDSLSGIGGVKRPGIVHRLDKDTSGLMVVAKTDRAHQGLAAQLADRSLSRRYLALVWKVPTLRKGSVDLPIGRDHKNRLKMAINKNNGRDAKTHYEIKETFPGNIGCLMECTLESGRTHQIRVHMTHIGHPLIGDPLYSLQPTAAQALLKKGDYSPEQAESIMKFPRQALHAWKIAFRHPVSDELMTFERELPADLKTLISIINQ